MAFTTWAALKKQMLDDLATGNWRHVSAYSVGVGSSTRSFQFRSTEEFMKLLDMVERRAAAEAAPDAPTCLEAVPKRSGRW